MKKYIIRVNILKSDNKGTFNSENFEYTFQKSFLIKARNKAIAKVKELELLFANEMREESKFSSPMEAELKGFRDFNAYSIDLSFVLEEDYEYQIYGEGELTIEALEVEATHYHEDCNIEFTEIEDLEGEYVEVLESDLEFFLN
jgi:hypothetical protein